MNKKAMMRKPPHFHVSHLLHVLLVSPQHRDAPFQRFNEMKRN